MTRRPTRSPLWRLSVDAEVREELEHHLELRTRQLVDEGADPREARERALAGFGDLERLAATCRRLAHGRDRRHGLRETLRELRQDGGLALRQLRSRPAFAATAVGILAIGIAAVTAVFGLIHPVLLAPLPLPEADRIVSIGVGTGRPGERQAIVAPIELGSWRDTGGALTAIAPYLGSGFTLDLGNDPSDLPQRVAGVWIGEDFFDVLPVRPIIGRLLGAADFEADATPTVLIGEPLWRQAFAADPAALGRSVRVDGRSMQVVGVLPEDVEELFGEIDVILPYALSESDYQQRASYLFTVGRLADGVSMREAAAALGVAQERANQARPSDERRDVLPIPLRESLVGKDHGRLWLLFGSVLLVLLIACSNVANLLLAQVLGRKREIGVRAALGAGRGRIVRQLLTESLVLSGLAGAVGLLGARVLLDLTVAAAPAGLPGLERATLSPVVLVFALSMVVVASAAAGLLPALRATRGSIAGLQARAASWRGERVRPVLVALQVALTFCLLALSGLLVRTAVREGTTDLGFDPVRLLTAQLSLPAADYPDESTVVDAFERLVETTSALPGVESAAAASRVAFAGPSLTVVYRPPEDPDRKRVAELRIVSGGYFSTLGVPVLAGRELTAGDRRDGRRVVAVNRTFAEAMWPGEPAVGRRLTTENAALVDASGESLVMEVVGVVGDSRDDGLRGPVRPAVFLPAEQVPAGPWSWIGNTMMLVARTSTSPEALADGLRRAVATVDPNLPVYNVATMEARLGRQLSRGRLNATLFSILGLVALLLALGGIYGLTAFFVSQQTFEIGIRLALGATRQRIVNGIVVRTLVPVLIGATLGFLLMTIVGRLASAELFGIEPGDPVTGAAVLVLILATALWASFVPAKQTTEVDPARTLTTS